MVADGKQRSHSEKSKLAFDISGLVHLFYDHTSMKEFQAELALKIEAVRTGKEILRLG